MKDVDIEKLVMTAKEGNREALKHIINLVQDRIFNLSLKMLFNYEDAQDATQEILIKMITKLSSFRGESSFYTWVYRIAVNHLLKAKQSRAEKNAVSFDEFEADIDFGSIKKWEETFEHSVNETNLTEIRISCLMGLLLCLNRTYRIAFLLSDLFSVSSDEGAKILGISPETYRKRLSRGKEKIKTFLEKNCGTVFNNNRCSCGYYADSNLHPERFKKENLLFADNYKSDNISIDKIVEEADELNRIGMLYRENMNINTPEVFITRITELISSERFKLLS